MTHAAAADPVATFDRSARRVGVLAPTVAGVTVCASAVLLLVTANPFVALIPPVLVMVAWAVATLPARVLVFTVLSLVMLADIAPSRLPDENEMWHSPVYPLQLLLTENLNKLTGVEALRFSGFEIVLLCLIVLIGLRALAGDRTDAAGRVAPARPLVIALVMSFAAIVALEIWGVARGGDVRQSLWQFRELLWMPVLALLLCATMRGVRDAILFAGLTAGVSCFKVLLGAYYYYGIARPLGVVPATVTSHADTLLFAVSIAVWLSAAYYRPARRHTILASALTVWVLFGIIINNRRTAYLTLLALVVMFYATLPRRARRTLTRTALLALPVLAAYVAVGANRSGAIFTPAAKLMSVVTQKDGSSLTRDIENYNLITTLHGNPLIGTGWGHPYVEAVHADDISKAFAQYRFIAHNSVLWIWSIGGMIGFTLIWLPIATGVFLAARARAFATTPHERAVAYGALATFVAFVIQAWADMGTQSWTTESMLAVALAASGQLAVSTGAWPQQTRLFGASVPRSGAHA